jgi:hypothetical protein
MTAQPSTKQDTADFAAQLRQLLTNSSDESNPSISATTANNNNNNCFNSQDFQKFLNENRDTINSSSSLDQIFKTSEFFKNQQSFSELFKSQQSLSDLFKSQQSFSQMFQSKDSFKELFQSLDSEQKKAIFSDAKDPLSPPASFPVAMDSPSSRMSSRSSSFAHQQSKDWKNLGSHIDVNYSHSKLFRDTSLSAGSDSSGPTTAAMPSPQQQSIDSAASAGKTNWGDFFFSQLQSGPAPSAPTAPAATAPVVVPPPAARKLPSPLPKNNMSKEVARKSGKRYISNPTEKDILMGRGGKSNHHPGNKRYREEILNFKKTYAQLTSKEEKTDLSRHVVDYVHKYKGRFLALDKSVNPPKWYEITDAVARRKVSQALREDNDPNKRKEKRARFLERKRQKEQAQA